MLILTKRFEPIMSFSIQDPDFRERVTASFERQLFMKHIGAELITIEPGICEIRLSYNENLTQQHGFFHAGIVSSLADSAAGYSAYSLMAADSSILTVEFKLNLLSPALGDFLIARSEVLKYGKTLTICRSDVYAIKNGAEKICAAAQCTLIELHGKSDG
jgi:uncharacterized protein (TIGR00369 family)